MAYGCFKKFLRRTTSVELIRDETFNTAKNPKYDEYQRRLASMDDTFLDETSGTTRANIFPGANTSGGAAAHADKSAIKRKIIPNQELSEELH